MRDINHHYMSMARLTASIHHHARLGQAKLADARKCHVIASVQVGAGLGVDLCMDWGKRAARDSFLFRSAPSGGSNPPSYFESSTLHTQDINCFGDETADSTILSSLWEGPPTRRELASGRVPLIFDREALRASARLLCRP